MRNAGKFFFVVEKLCFLGSFPSCRKRLITVNRILAIFKYQEMLEHNVIIKLPTDRRKKEVNPSVRQ